MSSLRPLALPFGFVALMSLATPQLGCGDNGSGGSGASGSGGAGGDGGSGGGSVVVHCDGAPAKLDLAGTWAAYGRLDVKLKGVDGGAITICPADQIGESTMLLLVTMAHDPADSTKLVNVGAVLCSMELPVVTALVGVCDVNSSSLVSTQIVVPPKLLESLPNVPSPQVSGSLGGTADGSTLALDRFTVTIGSSKPAPTMPAWDAASPTCTATNLGRTQTCEASCVDDCASLRDDDEEGFPGVTVHVCGKTPDDVKNNIPCNAEKPNTPGTTLQGRGFIDMEVNPLLTGQAKTSCEIEGTVDSDVLYNLVGADIYLAGAQIGATSAIKSLPSFEVDPTTSRFRMVRIDGQFGAPNWMVDPAQAKAACATLIARQNEL